MAEQPAPTPDWVLIECDECPDCGERLDYLHSRSLRLVCFDCGWISEVGDDEVC